MTPPVDRIPFLINDRLEFPVRDDGPLDGEVVVLLHGFPQTASAWEPFAALLNAAGYRTIAPTLRGYAPAARPRGRLAYRSSKLVGDLAALVAALGGEPVHLVGHDWGALLAWSTAARRPELVRSLLAVSVPHYAAFVRALFTSDQLWRSWYIVLFQLPLVPELLVRRFPEGFAARLRGSGMGAEEVDRVWREVVGTGALTGAINWYRGLVVSDQRAMSRPVTVPTTFAWGDADPLLGRAGADGTARFVRAPYALEILPGAGHWIPGQDAGALARVFLAAHASS
jgi:pimeloyl-ACP methyl ester carboxylesterase